MRYVILNRLLGLYLEEMMSDGPCWGELRDADVFKSRGKALATRNEARFLSPAKHRKLIVVKEVMF